MSKHQSSNPESPLVDPESPLVKLLPALTYYPDTASLGTAIFRCTAMPNRTAEEIKEMQRKFPGDRETLALSALHFACTEGGLVDNVPDSPALRLALGTDVAHLQAHEMAVRAARGEEHLRIKERSMRAAVFLREAATRKGLLALQIELLSPEIPLQPAPKAPDIPHQHVPPLAVDAVA